MKTTTKGTLEEWFEIDPGAMLINREIEFMSKGCYVQFPIKMEEPMRAVYNSVNPPCQETGYADPFFHSGGSFCLYKVRAKHTYYVSVGTIYGTSCLCYPIAKKHWDDPNWERIDKVEDVLL